MFHNRFLILTSRWVVALLLLFSGFAKAVNPFGLSLQLGEYLSAMGLSVLKPLAGVGAIALPAVEILLGIMAATGLYRRLTAWAVLGVMSFFTLLTLWIATTNPVSDCGCFGDLVKLTNWETFIKNCALMPFVVIFFRTNQARGTATPLILIVAVPLAVALQVWTLFNLPLIDATPFKVGVNIAEAMAIPADAKAARYESIVVCRNRTTGEVEKFAFDDPRAADDNRWEFVETQNRLIEEGFTPAIKSLPMLTAAGEDVSAAVLATRGRLWLVVTNREPSDELRGAGDSVVVLTSQRLPEWGTRVYHSDNSLLSTMIQNPEGGALLLVDGTIRKKVPMRKWMGERR